MKELKVKFLEHMDELSELIPNKDVVMITHPICFENEEIFAVYEGLEEKGHSFLFPIEYNG